MRIPRVKICGVKHAGHARAAFEAGAGAIGINFVPSSKRFIGSAAAARDLVKQCADVKCQWAGVFVDGSPDEMLELQKSLGLDILQLHGDESPESVAELCRRVPPSVAVWKAFRIATR